MFLWRRKFGVSYWESLTTPMQVIMNDLEMMSMESEYGQKKPDTNANKKDRGNAFPQQ